MAAVQPGALAPGPDVTNKNRQRQETIDPTLFPSYYDPFYLLVAGEEGY
jgi:hypothetical protein